MSLSYKAIQDLIWIEVQLVEQEFIRGLNINAKSLELIVWKVFDVKRHNDIRPPLDGRRQDMRVTSIWQGNYAFEYFPVGDIGVIKEASHHSYSPLDGIRRKFWMNPFHRKLRFLQNPVAP